MHINESPDPRSSMWCWIAYHLRFLRQERGESGGAVAELLHVARSSISRLENDEAKLTPDQAEILDNAWKTGGLFGIMVYYATRVADPEWFKSFTAFQVRASMIHTFNGQLIPDLFQTPAYVRSLLVAGRSKDLDAALAKRLARQEILQGKNPPELWVLLAESVLDWPVGGKAVMREQLARLLDLAALDHVTLRIVPRSAGAYEGLDGPFKVITVKEGRVGFIEAPMEGRLVAGSPEVESLKMRFERIGAVALPVDSSHGLITHHMEAMG